MQLVPSEERDSGAAYINKCCLFFCSLFQVGLEEKMTFLYPRKMMYFIK